VLPQKDKFFEDKKMPKTKIKSGIKQGNIFGVKISITNKQEVLDFVESRLSLKEKFYIVTPNPENVLIAKDDWLLKKAIMHADLSVPDGIGLSQAFKFLYFDDYRENLLRPLLIFGQGILVGLATIFNKNYLTDDLEIIKGRELFLDIIKIADRRNLRVCFVGGEKDEAEKSKLKLKETYKNIIIQAYRTPIYGKNAQPVSIEERKIHKSLLGKIKIFEPDLIFVALNTPKQEKWIFRNIYRINTIGAMTVGGTFNFISGNTKLPPIWMEKIGLEWVWRLFKEPKRWKRIVNAFPIFPWKVFLWKLRKQPRK